MLKANIATAKNELSRLLRRVKRGESVLITERNRPIAELRPCGAPAEGSEDALLASLHHSGVLRPPSSPTWDVDAFLDTLPPMAPLPVEQSLVAAVLAEREEST